MRALIGNWTAVALNQGSTLILGLVSVRLISDLVPPSVFGVYVLFVTLTQLAPMLIHSPEINHAARFWQRERRDRSGYPKFVGIAVWRKSWYLLPVLAVPCIGLSIYKRDPVWLWMWPLLWLGNLASSYTLLAQNGFNAGERRWTVLWVSLVTQMGRIIFPVGLVVLAGASLLSLALGFTLQAVVGLIVVGILLVCASRDSSNPTSEQRYHWINEVRQYGGPYIFLGIGAWLLQNADRWLTGLFFGDSAAGQFGLAIGVAGAIPTLLMGALMQMAFPAVFRAADLAKTRDDWKRLARKCDQISLIYLALGVAGLLLLRWIAPHLLGWLIAPKYEPALGFIIPAGCSALTASALQFEYLLLQGQAKSVEMVKVMSTVTAIKVAFCVAAGFFGVSAFLITLVVMVPLCFLAGRLMIQQIALGASAPAPPRPVRATQETF